MKKLFLETIAFIDKKAGYYAFRPKGPINASAFDSVMYIVAKNRDKLKEDLKGQIAKLFKDTSYLKAISEGTTDPESISTRMKIAKRYLVVE